MKRVLLFVAALLTFCSFYGQQDELKYERLTVSFEKQWSTAMAFSTSDILVNTLDNQDRHQEHIASYAPVFLEISLDDQTLQKDLLRRVDMDVFILRFKE